MLRTKQILTLLGAGKSQSAICAEVHCSKRTVSAVKRLADESGKRYDELLLLTDGELSTIFHVGEEAPKEDPRKAELERMMPEIVRLLNGRHAHIQYVFETYYLKHCPNGYGYTQFKKYVTDYRSNHDYSYHNTYEPGCEWQIDFAGDPLYLTDPRTKEKQKLVVLVCVMPYSNLPFMMALPNATTEWFFYGLNKGLEFLGALPKVAKSDNMKQWVTKSDRYSPTYSDANLEWAIHYGIEPVACRVRTPRDKGTVEGGVNQLYLFVYSRLENETHYSLTELNMRILELLDEYCSRPYKGSTRWDIYNTYEKPQMKPLPAQMYRFMMRKEVKLGTSYHVCVGKERHFYSVPFKYVGQMVKVMWDVESVEVYVGTQLVCYHDRSLVPYDYSTEKEHMPERHLAFERSKQLNGATLISLGGSIGPSVKWAIEDILKRTTFPQQAYGKCSGILSLAKKYGRSRLDHACSIIRQEIGTAGYKAISNMLAHGEDLHREGTVSRPPVHDDVRGASAYTSVKTDNEERKEKEDGQ